MACIGNNDKLIEDDMNKMGYFLGVRGDIQNIPRHVISSIAI